jgi:hypothetical protein
MFTGSAGGVVSDHVGDPNHNIAAAFNLSPSGASRWLANFVSCVLPPLSSAHSLESDPVSLVRRGNRKGAVILWTRHIRDMRPDFTKNDAHRR